MSTFYSLDVVDRGSETQLQAGKIFFFLISRFNHLTAGVAYIRVFIFY